MLTSLAYLTLPYLESDIPGHTALKSLELKTPSHPPSSCMSLLMGVPDQLPPQSRRTDYPLSFTAIGAGCYCYRQQQIAVKPEGVPAVAEVLKLCTLQSLFGLTRPPSLLLGPD